MTSAHQDRVKELIAEHGQTFAEAAGIKLADKPSPLYQLLVLSTLLSARISADIAVAAARELFTAGHRTPEAMIEATWQQRVDALGRGHYRRYDERTATMLGDGAELLRDRWHGDLRRLRDEASESGETGDTDAGGVHQLLQEFPGIGPTGADIFLREAQAVWPGLRPYADEKVLAAAKQQHLPASAEGLSDLAGPDDLPRLAAALIRAAG